MDEIEDAPQWARAAVEACLAAWVRTGRRYARRLSGEDRARSASPDVLTLAARRVVPLRRRLLRPLPPEGLSALARSFNALDAQDRYALRRLHQIVPAHGQQAEHLAAALERLLAGLKNSAGGA